MYLPIKHHAVWLPTAIKKKTTVNIIESLKKVLGKRMYLLCCTHYITNWANQQYENKAKVIDLKDELNEIFIRLNKDLQNPLYSGVGEIAFLHFNKRRSSSPGPCKKNGKEDD